MVELVVVVLVVVGTVAVVNVVIGAVVIDFSWQMMRLDLLADVGVISGDRICSASNCFHSASRSS